MTIIFAETDQGDRMSCNKCGEKVLMKDHQSWPDFQVESEEFGRAHEGCPEGKNDEQQARREGKAG